MQIHKSAPRLVQRGNWENPSPTFRYLEAAGVAVDAADKVYVLTRYDSRVVVYSASGDLLSTWGDTVLKFPHGITVAPDQTVYVADYGGHVVVQFSNDGRVLRVLGDGAPSETGYDSSLPDIRSRTETIVGGGPFNLPSMAAIAPSGDIFVSDGYGNCRIHRFTPDGALRSSWGESGSGTGAFRIPHAVAVDGNERVLVCDRENDRIQLFSYEGSHLDTWDQVQRPCDVAFDADGLIYVAELPRFPRDHSFVHGAPAEELPGRISVLASDGQVLDRLAASPQHGGYDLRAPHSIAIDSRGTLYVGEVSYPRLRAGVVAAPAKYRPIQVLERREVDE